MDEDMLQYKDLYLQTADEYMSSLNKSLLVLEKNPTDTEAIKEIFRSAHSLKSQSAAMGYNQTAFLCHTVEDIFSLLKDGLRQMTPELADLLFEALDALTSSLQNIAQKDKEIDLTAQAEKLKQLTGVDTQGVGKSKDAASTAKKSEEPPQTKNNDTTSKTATNKHLAPQVKTVSVKTSQLDDMMNMMEELLIHRLTLKKIADELGHDKLKLYYNQTEKILESLQFLIMQARTVPLSIVFDHFPRAVRDVARKENKDISFRIIGADLKLDRTIVDRLDEPLIHILRNAVSHGIEKKGEIVLSAEREEDFAVIKVKDNGRGVNWKRVAEKANVKSQDVNVLKKYLFSGISTAEQITEVSGRGVGLQAVEKMVNQIGGRIDVESVAGHGTTFILKLPLTLAVTKALLVSVGKEKYAIAAPIIDRSITISSSEIRKAADQELFALEDQEIPLLRVSDILQIQSSRAKGSNKELVVIVKTAMERIGLIVDEINEVLEIIIKPMPHIIKDNKAFAGATILGDGRTALILNPNGILELVR